MDTQVRYGVKLPAFVLAFQWCSLPSFHSLFSFVLISIRQFSFGDNKFRADVGSRGTLERRVALLSWLPAATPRGAGLVLLLHAK